MFNQKILDVKFADFCEFKTTIEVTISSNNEEEIFYVQTVDNEFRSDLGCWITTQSSSGNIDFDDYQNFDRDSIIFAAESFIQKEIKEEATDYFLDNERVYLLVSQDDVKIVKKNNGFINSVTSSYEREYSDSIEDFKTKEEALNYLESLDDA